MTRINKLSDEGVRKINQKRLEMLDETEANIAEVGLAARYKALAGQHRARWIEEHGIKSLYQAARELEGLSFLLNKDLD